MTNDVIDPCASRHKGNEQSIAAFLRVNVTKGQQQVIDALSGQKMTSKELATALGKPLHCISGRIAELKAKNRVRPTGTPRGGAMELELVPDPVADDGTPLGEVLAKGISQVMDRAVFMEGKNDGETKAEGGIFCNGGRGSNSESQAINRQRKTSDI